MVWSSLDEKPANAAPYHTELQVCELGQSDIEQMPPMKFLKSTYLELMSSIIFAGKKTTCFAALLNTESRMRWMFKGGTLFCEQKGVMSFWV